MKGIQFDNIHSYNDLNLVLSSISISPATPKTNYVDIPGGDGSVDLTEAFGEVKYKDRDCKVTFTVFPHDDFEEKKTEISNLLNGRRCKAIIDKDPDYYWEGRWAVDEYKSNKNLHQIAMTAVLSPYKLKNNKTVVVIQPGENVIKSLLNGRKTVVPVIENENTATITFRAQTFKIDPGTHKILNVELVQGVNRITVTSAGSVKFTYQEGDL